MKVVFLGTTGYHPNNSRHTACLIVPELGLVFDAGTGLFRARDHLQTSHLEIFLSHVHLDHCVGLTFLFDVLRDQDVGDVRVYGETDKLAALDEHLFSSLLFPVKPPCEFVPLRGESHRLISGGEVRWFPLEHPGGSLGFVIEHQGQKMAYVTDTTASVSADYVDHVRGVDMLIHECYFPDGQEQLAKLTGHSCATPVAEVAAAAGVGKLILVHVDPMHDDESSLDCDSMRRIFPNITLACDGLEVDWGRPESTA